METSNLLDVAGRLYTCMECGRRFTQKGNLKRHVMSVHKGDRPFACNQCDATFGTKRNLSRHISAVHKKEKLFHS